MKKKKKKLLRTKKRKSRFISQSATIATSLAQNVEGGTEAEQCTDRRRVWEPGVRTKGAMWRLGFLLEKVCAVMGSSVEGGKSDFRNRFSFLSAGSSW